MKTYNKIMLYFWLGMSILITTIVTFMGFKEGFDRWYFYYVFSLLALLAFITRKWMMKRMEKHVEWMEQEQKRKNEGK
jgi:cell division protein FtsW (lipid II flippase)